MFYLAPTNHKKKRRRVLSDDDESEDDQDDFIPTGRRILSNRGKDALMSGNTILDMNLEDSIFSRQGLSQRPVYPSFGRVIPFVDG